MLTNIYMRRKLKVEVKREREKNTRKNLMIGTFSIFW